MDLRNSALTFSVSLKPIQNNTLQTERCEDWQGHLRYYSLSWETREGTPSHIMIGIITARPPSGRSEACRVPAWGGLSGGRPQHSADTSHWRQDCCCTWGCCHSCRGLSWCCSCGLWTAKATKAVWGPAFPCLRFHCGTYHNISTHIFSLQIHQATSVSYWKTNKRLN